MAQPATKRTPPWNRPFLGQTNTGSTTSLGEVEGTMQTGTLSQRKHLFGHATRPKT